MVGVKEFLTHVPEREKGGQTALDRFDYQTAWGVSRLLDLHEKGENYAVAFEFHDDIVALDEAQDFATQWLWTYNNDRPNMGIGGITPAQKLKMAS